MKKCLSRITSQQQLFQEVDDRKEILRELDQMKRMDRNKLVISYLLMKIIISN